MGYKRRQLMESYEDIMDLTQKIQKERESGQSNFFEALIEDKNNNLPEHTIESNLDKIAEWDQKKLLAYEKETLGFYITGHPLVRFAEKLSSIANADSSTISEKKDRDNVSFGGVVSAIREVTTRKKDIMAYVTLEDFKGSVTTIFFADIYRKAFDLLHNEDPVLIKGLIDAGEEGVKVIASEVIPLGEEMNKSSYSAVRFRIDVAKSSSGDIEKLSQLLRKHAGKSDGYIHIMDDKSEVVIYLGSDSKLDLSNHLKEAADSILGCGSTQFF
jgi:DNA polymerase-3 subunit alpha